MPMQDKDILEIVQTNSAPPPDFAGNGAAAIAGGEFPLHSRQEWRQVGVPAPTDPPALQVTPNTGRFGGTTVVAPGGRGVDDDYDFDPVGTTGWVLNPHRSNSDIPFSHPFESDWEFMMVVDPDYDSLLARGNQVRDDDPEAANRADAMGIPVPLGPDGIASLLGVEMDGGLVPTTFSDGVAEGDRVAVFGRWIVDCGHAVQVKVPNQGDDTYRSEIHPPLLLASARVEDGATGVPMTRVLFTSRPYLTSQRYTTDTDKIYDDTGPDDGPFVTHMLREIEKVDHVVLGIPLDSTMVEAHPQIKSKPFRGVHLAHIVVRPPPAQSRPTGPPALEASLTNNLQQHVRFQFTVRSGCAVQVTSSATGVIDIFISLSDAGYQPPELLSRSEHTWTKDALDALRPGTGAELGWGEVLNGLFVGLLNPLSGGPIGIDVTTQILERGIKTDTYDCTDLLSKNILDRTHAVDTTVDQLRGGMGVVVDDIQPFPVFGWLETDWEWELRSVVAQPEDALPANIQSVDPKVRSASRDIRL